MTGHGLDLAKRWGCISEGSKPRLMVLCFCPAYGEVVLDSAITCIERADSVPRE